MKWIIVILIGLIALGSCSYLFRNTQVATYLGFTPIVCPACGTTNKPFAPHCQRCGRVLGA